MSDAAIASIVSGAVTIFMGLLGFLTLYVKLRYGEKKSEQQSEQVEAKLDQNTIITRAGVEAAIDNARAAVESAQAAAGIAHSVKETTDNISRKLNGGVDTAISDAVSPVQESIATCNNRLSALDAKLEELSKYVHQRNHDILNAMQVLANNAAVHSNRLDSLACTVLKEKK